MAEKQKRRRSTIASMMIGIAALSLVLLFVLPVLRQGWPTCMTTYATVKWLAHEPGRASCATCHSPSLTLLNPPPVPGVLAASMPTCPARGKPDRASCLTCHAN